MSISFYRFDSYVFYKETGTLKRNGYSVRLSDQSAKVLAQFLEQPNQLVTRTQLAELLWPDGIHTENKQGINNIISKLRTTLRDSPQKPKFIETIPQRGYRFLASVSVVSGDPTELAQKPADEPAPAPELALALAEPTTEVEPAGQPAAPVEPPKSTKHSPTRLLAVFAASLLTAACLLGGIFLWRHFHPVPASANRQISLAVAPFEVLGSAPDRQQFAESFRLDLTDALAQLPGIQVRAAHSVGQRGSPPQGARSPADPLDIDAILFIQFTQNADQCALQVELARSSDSTHLAAWHYAGSTAQLGAIRDQLQRDIFAFWNGPGKSQKSLKGGTEDAAAYEFYLRARYHARQRTPDSIAQAVREYQQAIERDPQFARAYAGLADASLALGAYHMVADSKSSFANAEKYAAKALELAPNLAEAHAILGYMYFHNDWRFGEGEQELRHAIALEPNEPIYHVWYATLLTQSQRFSEASAQLEIAKHDDPYWAPIYANEGYLDASSNQPAKLQKAADMLVSLKPDWPGSYDELAWGYWLSGHPEKAVGEWRRMAVLQKDEARVALEDEGMTALREGGVKAYASLRLKAALARQNTDPADPDYQVAEWYAYSGDYENCIQQLQKLVDSHDTRALEIAVNPAYAPLHHDPRYLKLLGKVGLPPQNLQR